MTEKKTQKRRFQGTVVSVKMAKTATVLVGSVKVNKKYNKQYHWSNKYKVHDEKNQAKVGDVVVFEECRPISKEKRWRLLEIKK